jgi:hypothetical protein
MLVPEISRLVPGLNITLKRPKIQKFQCGNVRSGYVRDQLNDEETSTWYFVNKHKESLGHLTYDKNGCEGAPGNTHVKLNLICIDPTKREYARLGTLMLVNFLLVMFEQGIRTVYLEIAANSSHRSSKVEDKTLLCWYESFGFKRYTSSCSSHDSYPIHVLKLRAREKVLELLSGCIWIKKSCEKYCANRLKKPSVIKPMRKISKSMLTEISKREKIPYKRKTIDQLYAQLDLPKMLLLVELRTLLKEDVVGVYKKSKHELQNLF